MKDLLLVQVLEDGIGDYHVAKDVTVFKEVDLIQSEPVVDDKNTVGGHFFVAVVSHRHVFCPVGVER